MPIFVNTQNKIAFIKKEYKFSTECEIHSI